MAKQAIASSDLTLLRGNHHYISDVRLNIFKPAVVATATIDATPTDNPVASLVVTGDVSDTEIGQRFIIRDGSSNIVTHGALRKATSGQTLNISPVSIGDSGYVSPIKRAITATDTITVYKDRPLWGDYSRIANGVFRKYWDVSYSDQNEDVPPIANTGASQSASVEVGATADFTLPRLGSNDSIVFGSKTISSYLWVLPPGVSLKAGYATSDSVIEVTASQGQHIIKLTVTDSNAKTHTSYMYLFVSDGLNYIDLMEQYKVTIDSDSQDTNGRTITFTVYGDDLDDTIYPASYVHLQHDSIYDGSPVTDGVDVDTFVGYITDYQYSHNGDFGQATITAMSPYLYLQKVFMPPQLITEVGNPGNWSQVDSTISNPRGALQYVRWHCQNLFSMHDIDANSITTPRKYSYEYNGKTIAGGLDIASQAIVGNVGSASDGTIVLRQNPNHEDNTFRNALDVGMTFTADDVNAPLSHAKTANVPYADVRAGAFAYDGGGANSIKAWYGVKRWSQGGSETVLPDFTVDKTDGKNKVLEKVGHMAANILTPNTQPIIFNRNINVVDPAYMVWYQLNIGDEFDPRGEGWSNTRFLVQRVTRNWDNENMELSTQAEFKEESFGQKADEWIVGSGQSYFSGDWLADYIIPYAPDNNDFSVLPNVAVAHNTSGDLAITQSFTDATPQWSSLNEFVTGTVCDVAYDYNSAFFTGGYITSEPLSLYIVSVSGTTLYVYRLYDIKSAVFEVDELETYTMADTSTTTSARIECSSGTGTLAVVAWHDRTGVEFGRTTDGGTTWSAKANVGDAVTDTDNDNAEIGLYISGVNQVITAPNSSIEYGIYLATTAGGSFSKLANSEDNTAPHPMITGDGDTTLYVATDNDGGGGGGTLEETVDFDGGYSSYTYGGSARVIGDGGSSINSDTYGGNGGGNAVGITEGGTGVSLAAPISTVQITFSPAITIEEVKLDLLMDTDWLEYLTGDTHTYVVSMTKTAPSTPVASPEYTVDTYTASADNDPLLFPNNGVWQEKTMTFSSAQSVETLDITFQMKPPATFRVNSTTAGCLRMDNIKIYSASGGVAIDPLLYKVTTYTATDAWGDATPATDYIPQLPYGLAVDIANTDNIELMATNDTTPKYFSSVNATTAWTDNGASDYRTVKRLGDAIIYSGVDVLDLSVDNGATVSDKTGNLAIVWGTIGTIKQVLVLV